MAINGKDILYHGTAQPHNTIELIHSKKYKDFGKGYYLTSNINQAINWAQTKGTDQCWVYLYNVKDIPHNSNIIVEEYVVYDRRWLDFISSNRTGGNDSKADIIYDRMADSTFAELTQMLYNYAAGKISADYMLKEIPFPEHKNRDQYCFKTKRAIALLERISELHYRKIRGKWELENDDIPV